MLATVNMTGFHALVMFSDHYCEYQQQTKPQHISISIAGLQAEVELMTSQIIIVNATHHDSGTAQSLYKLGYGLDDK